LMGCRPVRKHAGFSSGPHYIEFLGQLDVSAP
jgi:hypothetical protein